MILPILQKHKRLCSLKWDYYLYDLVNDRLRACCKTISDQNATSIEDDLKYLIFTRKQMLTQLPAEDCNVCWQMEASGIKSFRTVNEKFVADVGAGSISANTHAPQTLELLLAKTCDLKCIYCGPYASSRWQLSKGMTVTKFKYTNEIKDRLYRRILPWWDTLSYINLVGGEPLIQESFYSILRDLLAIPSIKKKTYRVITNLNCNEQYMDKFISLLSEYPKDNFQITVSNESIGELSESIRDGLSFKRFDKNLNRLLSETSRSNAVFFLPTINSVCLVGLPEFYLYLAQKMMNYRRDILLIWNLVYDPKHLAPWTQPEKLTKSIELSIDIFDRVIKSPLAGPILIKNWSDYREALLDLGKSRQTTISMDSTI